MNEETLEVIHRDQYKQDHRGSLIVLVLLLCLALLGTLMIVSLTYSIGHPKPVYFTAVDEDRLFQSSSMQEPSLEDNIVLNWLVDAVMTMYNGNFTDFERTVKNAEGYFVEEGFDLYWQILQGKELLGYSLLERMLKEKLVLSSQPMGVPTIKLKGALHNVYYWKIEIPMQLVFYGGEMAQANMNESVLLTCLVRRVPTDLAPLGIAIKKIEWRRLSSKDAS